jgi:hypothetical protein
MAAPLPPDVVAQAAARRLGFGQQRDTSLQSAANQYNENIANLNKFSDTSNQQIMDQMGAQGLANSGIRVDQQGKLQQNVAQRRGFLEQGYGTQQQGIQNQYASQMTGVDDWLSQMANQYTQQNLSKQQQDAQIALQQQQADLQRQQLAQQQWNAALAQNQSAGGGGGGGAPAPAAGPSQSDIDYWNAVQYLNAVKQWNAVVAWNAAMASNNRTEFAGAGNPLGMPGARFK